jgi:galactose mutarotase-like enzyme
MLRLMSGSDSNVELNAANTSVTVAPHRGALVTSFRVGDRELLYLDPATFADPKQNVRGGIPVLFPSPGKLEGDAWSYDGRQGSMKQHGFARNLAWTIAGQRPDSLVLAIEANEQTLAQFPWDFRVSLAFTVSAARLRLSMTIENRSDSTMPCGVGYHPYFQVEDKARARIDTAATRAFDNLARKRIDFFGFDLTQREVDLHLLDHGSNVGTLRYANGARLSVSASPEFRRWVVWTLAGKEFVCLEPWTGPGNALNTREGLLELPPGRSRELWVEVAFVE